MMATEVAPAVTMTPQVVSREPRAPRRRLLRVDLAGLLLGCVATGRPMEAAWLSRTICRGGLCLGGIILLRVDVTLAASSDLCNAACCHQEALGQNGGLVHHTYQSLPKVWKDDLLNQQQANGAEATHQRGAFL